jgi:hypothetical protein
MFSTAFTVTYERYVREIRIRKPVSVLVTAPSKWYALVLAWRDTTKSTYWEGVWKGPGVYRLSGYNNDRGCPVASVTWEKEPPQMEFNL